MGTLFLFILILLMPIISFAEETVESAFQPIWDAITPFIIDLAERFPIIAGIIFTIGTARFFLKPTFTLIENYVRLTPTKSDDIILDKIKAGLPYKILCFILDWAFSVKLKK